MSATPLMDDAGRTLTRHDYRRRIVELESERDRYREALIVLLNGNRRNADAAERIVASLFKRKPAAPSKLSLAGHPGGE